ncbi:MAG: hypothetical protein QOI61_1029 [Actinomycetota bacterium]
MVAATESLDRIARELVERHRGTQVKPRGEADSYFLVFDDALDAVLCAVAFQRAVLNISSLPIRSACHVGAAELRDGDWYGTTVNRCARLRAAAHARQALVSAEVAADVGGRLPEGVSLRSLGRHRLKDLDEPAEVFQVCASGLVEDHPALPTLAQSHGLTLPRSSFVGRSAECDRVVGLLDGGGIVTVTGTPGVGTTRFATEAAARWWERHGTPVRVGRARTAAGELVLVDEADGAVDTAVLKGPAIVTARAALGVVDETVVAVAPLDQFDAELLLKDRLDDEVRLPSGLVRYCDGLPLAIELLARRASSVDAEVLAERLAVDPLAVLGGDRRAEPPRHASMRATFQSAFDAGWRAPDAPSPLVAAFFEEMNRSR